MRFGITIGEEVQIMGGEEEGKVKRKEGRRKEEEEDAHRERWGLIFFVFVPKM